MAKHVLILIHGITPEPEPEVRKQYKDLIDALQTAGLPIAQPISQISWGVPEDAVVARPDHHLTPAQQFVGSLVEEQRLRAGTEPLGRSFRIDWGIPVLRGAIQRVRESVVLYGLGDAIYYASPEGESAVRDAVFGQVFDKLEASEDGEIHLHIVAHSLGVAVAHDFLYALFGVRDPEFPSPTTGGEIRMKEVTHALQLKWRGEAIAGRLKLGTFISFASQLPLFVMRKQALVERLARGKRLDPRVIGVVPELDRVQWAIFYDSDDLLGFATRPLYEETPAIVDIHMNSGLEPLSAHLGYWHKPAIIERCVALLRANMK